MVTVLDIAGPAISQPNFDDLATADRRFRLGVQVQEVARRPEAAGEIAELNDRAGKVDGLAHLAVGFTLHQLQTLIAHNSELPFVVKTIHEDISQVGTADDPLFPASSVHFVQRDIALVHRIKLPAVLLRIAHDAHLRNDNLQAAVATGQRGELVFAAASGLSDGIMLMDAYLARPHDAVDEADTEEPADDHDVEPDDEYVRVLPPPGR